MCVLLYDDHNKTVGRVNSRYIDMLKGTVSYDYPILSNTSDMKVRCYIISRDIWGEYSSI